jgi:Raf kinase inhibitor-like YbhB/YbcL family protein
VALVALCVGSLPLVAACGGGDGRTLRAPEAGQTTTTTVATSLPADATGENDGGTSPTTQPLRLSSPALADGAEIPVDHTCRGRDVSLPLQWTGIPEATIEIAVVMRDVDADGLVHWVVAGLPPSTGGLAEGTVPEGAVETDNDLGRPGWAGPCPASGTHNYEITLYALSQASGLTAGQPGAEAAEQLELAATLATAALSGSATAAG